MTMGVLAGEVCGGKLILAGYVRDTHFRRKIFGWKCGFRRVNILAGKYKLCAFFAFSRQNFPAKMFSRQNSTFWREKYKLYQM